MPEPPPDYKTPPFPSLNVHTLSDETSDKIYTLYHIGDVWRFTVVWTVIVYAVFHLGAVMVAFMTHGFKRRSWKLLWLAPIVYLSVAGVEAVLSGSIVGLIVGAVYQSGDYEMNTWIPCIWGFICLLILLISSFTIQGAL
ncbi:integral membrane protein [Cordyceps javanica]|uniref:Integral membrane protein n=1 Tax=Cordyceps javanica TaxID=43265 RepID=A0A545V4R8_9HYPO|nr:integral membrane protein [Cordyceps javanica]TQW07979.1 integral membrane protein [Cordyceps javanica]